MQRSHLRIFYANPRRATARVEKPGLHIGAVTFIHWLGSIQNEHVRSHTCEIALQFEVVSDEGAGQSAPSNPAKPPNINFHEASGIDEA